MNLTEIKSKFYIDNPDFQNLSDSDDEENDTEEVEKNDKKLNNGRANLFTIDTKPDLENLETGPSQEKKIGNGQVRLSSKLKTQTKIEGYLRDKNPMEMLNNIETDFIDCHKNEFEKKRAIGVGFEKDKHMGQVMRKSLRQKRKERRLERSKTAGRGWFDLPANESQEVERDLMLLQMRNALDAKRFYKKSDHRTIPKYAQLGTVVESPEDYYNDRVPKKERQQTLVEELLADAEFKKKLKKRFKQAVREHPHYIKLRRKMARQAAKSMSKIKKKYSQQKRQYRKTMKNNRKS